MKTLPKTDHSVIAITTSCLLSGFLIEPALSQSKLPIQLEASIGTQYDSNIAVEEIDTNTTTSDLALLVDIDVDYSQPLSTDLTFNTGYSFSQSLYEDLDQFNIQTHLFSAGLAYDFDAKTAAGLNYNYADASLDDDGFLSLSRISPFVSYYISKKLFARTAFTYTDKSFDGRSLRDAQATGLGADLYYFLNGPRHYVIAGYDYKNEDSNSPRFDYDSYQLKVRWIKRINFLDKRSKLKLGWRYEQRDYEDISSAGGQQRDDSRQRWLANIEIPLLKDSDLSLEYEYRDYESNINSADYVQHMVTVEVAHKFF